MSLNLYPKILEWDKEYNLIHKYLLDSYMF